MATIHMIQGYIGVGKTDLAKEIEESFPAVRFTPDESLAILWEDPQAETQADFDARMAAWNAGEDPISEDHP